MKLDVVEDKQGRRIKDVEMGSLYGRIVAGLAWPKGNIPGAAVALAEGLRGDPVDGVRPLRLVAWETEADVERLLETASLVCPWAGDSLGRSLVSVWVGDPWHPFARRLRPLNDRLTAQRRPRLNLRAAPGVGRWQMVADWAPYVDARTIGRQALLLHDRELQSLVEDAGVDARRPIVDFPSVAALFWAVAACDERSRGDRAADHSHATGDKVAGY